MLSLLVLVTALASTSGSPCSMLSSQDWALTPASFLLPSIKITWNTTLAECSERGESGTQWREFDFQLLVTEHSKHSLMWNEDIQRISVTLSPLYRLKCSPDNIDIPASYAPNCQKMMRIEFLCGKSGSHMLSCFLFFSKSL